MKVAVGDNTIIVGKRITVGAGFMAIAKIVGSFFPDYALVAYETATVVTLITQMLLANYFSHTTKE